LTLYELCIYAMHSELFPLPKPAVVYLLVLFLLDYLKRVILPEQKNRKKELKSFKERGGESCKKIT